MKVLKIGVLPKDRIYTVTCAVCESVIEYMGSEAVRTSYDYRNDLNYEFECNTCGHRSIIFTGKGKIPAKYSDQEKFDSRQV